MSMLVKKYMNINIFMTDAESYHIVKMLIREPQIKLTLGV